VDDRAVQGAVLPSRMLIASCDCDCGAVIVIDLNLNAVNPPPVMHDTEGA
jgi:hypothetical protein